jgi:DNA-binding transcriptional regulator YiaG
MRKESDQNEGETMGLFDKTKRFSRKEENANREKMPKMTKVNVASLESFSPAEIREIRMSLGMTQIKFAQYMGVSVKTVEAWEAGRNHPDGPSCRLLTLTRSHPNFAVACGILY